MLFSQALYIGQYKHGLYAFPSLVDELTTFIASHTGRLLLEGPDSGTETSETSSDTSSKSKIPLSVNLRLPSDMAIGWADQYYSQGSTHNKPSIKLFGRFPVWLTYLFISFIKQDHV